MRSKKSHTSSKLLSRNSARSERSSRRRTRRTTLLCEPLEARTLLAADLFSGFDELPSAPTAQPSQDLSTPAYVPALSSSQQAEGEQSAEGEDQQDLVAFAKALAQANVKYFGAFWCIHCAEQKQLFQDGADYLPYIEVSNPDRTLNQVGQTTTSARSPPGCSRTTRGWWASRRWRRCRRRRAWRSRRPASPRWRRLRTRRCWAVRRLFFPLDGYDPNSDALTYTVTSSNPQVTATVTQNNPSMKITVRDNASYFGDMVFQLFEDKAPRPVDRVMEWRRDGFYNTAGTNKMIFHRVIPGFVIQGGDPTGTGSGGSTLGNFDDQFNVDLQHNRDGMLSYAKSSDDTNDSQFFVTLGPRGTWTSITRFRPAGRGLPRVGCDRPGADRGERQAHRRRDHADGRDLPGRRKRRVDGQGPGRLHRPERHHRDGPRRRRQHGARRRSMSRSGRTRPPTAGPTAARSWPISPPSARPATRRCRSSCGDGRRGRCGDVRSLEVGQRELHRDGQCRYRTGDGHAPHGLRRHDGRAGRRPAEDHLRHVGHLRFADWSRSPWA